MKKIFIISLILLFFVLLFLGIYNFAFKKQAPIITQSKNTTNSSQTSLNPPQAVSQNQIVVKTQKIIPMTNQGAIGAVFDKKNNEIIYYSAQDGTTWKIDPDGNEKQQISSTKLTGLKNVIWSPDRSKVLTTLSPNGQDTFYQYDYLTQKAVTLKTGLDTAVWDNLGLKIFYKYYDIKQKTRSLNISNPDGSDWKKLTDVDARNLSIAQIPLTSLVSFWNQQNANEPSKLQTVGIIGGDVKTVFEGRYGADYLWAPNGTQALVSSLVSKDSKMTILGVVTADGKYKDISIATLASKCVWSTDSKTIYCAVPINIPDGFVLPDDYLNNKFTTRDEFLKIDAATGKKEQILSGQQDQISYDAISMFISPTEDAIYFTNKIDGKLYKLSL